MLFLIWVLPQLAHAHHISPNPAIVRNLDGTVTVSVEDCCGCNALITATSTMPTVFTVSPSQGEGTKVSFVVTPVSYGGGVLIITINGVGSDSEGNPCTEVSANPVPVYVVNEPVSTGNTTNVAVARDPVNTFSGEYFIPEAPDLALGGPIPVEFTRRYSSRLMAEGMAECGLGQNWTHNYNWHLYHAEDVTEVVTDEGRVLRFLPDGEEGWALESPLDIPFQLVGDDPNFTLGDPRTQYVYKFDFQGKLSQILDGKGNQVFLLYDGEARLSQVNDFLGRSMAFTYDEGDMLTSVTGGGASATFAYTGDLLISFTDPRGKTTTFSYDSSVPFFGGLMISKTLPLGNAPYTQTYDTQGRVATQTDAYANTFTFTYLADKTRITGPDGEVFEHAYDSAGALTGFTDESGGTADVTYDANGQRSAVAGRDGATNMMEHEDVGGNPTRLDFADGTSATLAYTSRTTTDGIVFTDLSSVTYPDGTTETRTLDANGNVTQMVARNGGITNYTYTNGGRLQTVETPIGGVYTFTYDSGRNLASIDDPAGNTTSFDYDVANRMNLVTYPDSNTINYTHDNAGNLLFKVDEAGQTWAYAYNDNGFVDSTADPYNELSTYAYDLMDRLLSVTDPLGESASQEYDGYGRVATMTGRDGSTLTRGYDARGFLTSVTGPEGFDWQYGYDPEGLLFTETDPLGHIKAYERDEMGSITRIFSPRNATTSIEYDAISRPIALRDPLGNRTEFEFDSDSNLVRATQPLEGAEVSEVNYEWDNFGNLLVIEDPSLSQWENEYDNQGRLMVQRDPLGAETTFTYDNRNRVDGVAFPGALGTLARTYTDTGNVLQQDYSDGLILDYAYDNAGRLVQANGLTMAWNARDDMVESNGLDIAYDAGGRIEVINYAPGKTVTYAYDARGQLTTVTDWVGQAASFVYDAAGRCTNIARANNVETFKDYDEDNNLISLWDVMGQMRLAAHTLTRDLKGQVIHADRQDVLAATPVNAEASNTFDDASQDRGATYDAMGRVTARGAETYTWDLASRMTGYSSGSPVTF